MPCYYPLAGYRSSKVNPSGKRSIVFNVQDGLRDLQVEVPCGQCIGCRLERSRQWAIRCVHEASLYEDNCFITLTYDDEHLPKDNSLDLRHFQTFMKRLRRRYGAGVRYFHCGEYGETFARPHYHACLFNFDFSDKELWSVREGIRVYRSESLNSLWPFGFSTIGSVTFESAAYVARYITKKVSGAAAEAHYAGRRPEYTTMSRRPGIGRVWFEKYLKDVFPDDFVVIRGIKMTPPKYYSSQFEHFYLDDFEKVRARRVRNMYLSRDNNTIPRLRVREKIQRAKAKLLLRRYESESV